MTSAAQYTVAVRLTADASQYGPAFQAAEKTTTAFSKGAQSSLNATTAALNSMAEGSTRAATTAAQGMAQVAASTKQSQSSLNATTAALNGMAEGSTKAATTAAQGMAQVTASTKQTAAAMRMLGPQMTDIAVGLSTGQSPFMVLMQQGGQLKDMFGGIGPAARAVGVYVAGMVTPLTATAAAAALLVAGFYAGSQESRALQTAIINSGNAAGVTSGQLMGMAKGVDAVVGTQSRAVEVLSAFVATGKVGAAHLEEFTTAAMRFEAVGGAAAEDTAKAFAELGKAPLEASLKLNESMHYLTASTYQQIKALTEQGKATDAADVAQKAFADTLASRSEQMAANLGLVEKGWLDIKSAVLGAWSSIKSVGRDMGAEGELAKVNAEISNISKQIDLRGSYDTKTGYGRETIALGEQLAHLKERQSILQSDIRLQRQSAAAQAEQVALTEKLVDWDKKGEQFQAAKQKRDEEIRRAQVEGQALIVAGKITEKDLQERIAAIREKYQDKTVTGDTELANLKARVAAEQRNLDLLRGQGLHYDKINEGERTALQLTEQLTGKLDAKTRKSKEAQLVQAKALADVLNAQEAERQYLQARQSAAQLDERLTAQQSAQYQQSIDQLIAGNEQLRTEIDLVGQDTAARRAYLDAKAQEVIKAKELEVINLRNAGSAQVLIDKAEQELRLLRDKGTLQAQLSSSGDSQAAKDMLDAIVRETDALAMTNEQREVSIALRELENKGIKAGSAAYAEYIPKIKAAIADQSAIKQSIGEWSSIENTAHQAWTAIGEDGVGAAKRIGRALEASVWDWLWQITARQWTIQIGASLGMPGAQIAAQQAGMSGAASAFGGIGGYGSLYNGFATSGIGQALGLSETVTGGLTAAGDFAAASSTTLTGLGSSIGAALPWIGAAMGVLSLLSSLDNSGTMHTGGLASYSKAGGGATGDAVKGQTPGFFNLASADYQASTERATAAISKSIVGILDSTASTFGKAAGYYAATGFADDSSKDGAWGGLIVKIGDQIVADWGNGGDGYLGKLFSDGQQGVAEYNAAVAKSVRDYMITQVPDWAAAEYKALGETPSLENLATVAASVNAAAKALDVMGKASSAFAGITSETTAELIKGLGGAQASTGAMSGYLAAYYTDAERASLALQEVQKGFADLGVTMPATKADLRAMIDAAIAAGDGDLAAKLIGLSDAFGKVKGNAKTALESFGLWGTMAAEKGDQGYIDKLYAAYAKSTDLQEQYDILQQIKRAESALTQSRKDSIAATTTAISAQIASVQAQATAVDAVINAAQSLRSTAQGMVTSQAAASSTWGREYLSARFASQASLARGGAVDAMAALPDTGRALIDNAGRTARTESEYQLVVGRVSAQMARAADDAEANGLSAKSYYSSQLDALNEQLKVANEQTSIAYKSADLEKDLLERAKAAYEQDALNAQINQTVFKNMTSAIEALPDATANALYEVMTGKRSGGAKDDSANSPRAAYVPAPGGPVDMVEGMTGSTSAIYGAHLKNAAQNRTAYEQAQTYINSTQGRALGSDEAAAKAAKDAGLSDAEVAALQAAAKAYEDYVAATGHQPTSANDFNDWYGKIPKLSVGTNYVPAEMLAVLHPGEAVLPERFNFLAGNGGEVFQQRSVVSAIEALRSDQQAQAAAIATMQAAMNRVFSKWDRDGMPAVRA